MSLVRRNPKGPDRAALLLAFGGSIIAACATTGVSAKPAPAEIVLTNARVYTVEEGQPWAEAVAISGGRIVAVGTAAEIAAWRGEETHTVDLGGKLLMPSFGDAHVHPIFGGMSYSRCSLHDGETVEDYQQIIRGCIEKTPGDGPVYGVGWQDHVFPPNGIPLKEGLDAVSTTRPLVFESVGGHSYWVNSRALELAGITRDTPDPAGGHIDRDPATGEPVGGLQESAMGLVSQFVAAPTAEEMHDSIVYVTQLFNSLGITGMHDAGIDLAADGTSRTLDAYKAVLDRGELTTHVSLAFKWENERSLEQIPVILAARARAGEWGLHAPAVKFYVDGVIPQKTAAMIDPYEHSHGERGSVQIPEDVLRQAVVELGAQGIQPHIHAIGDRATRIALDVFEASKIANGDARRPMISHLNVIEPEDQPRFGEIGVIAVFQPTWSANYPYMDLTKDVIGPVRSQYIYPANGVLKHGGMIAYGADWPVATANPLEGIQVAVTRINYADAQSPPLLPDEGIPLAEAVRAHTLNVAYANGMETVTGSIKPGKSADLVILDRNIFDIPAMEISQAKVLVTFFEGRPVYGTLDGVE